MNYEASRLRQLAQALDFLEALNGFDYQVRLDEIKVDWITGRSCNGFKEMSAAIAEVVSERYQGLRLEAIAKAEKRVAELRRQLAEAVPSESERTTHE